MSGICSFGAELLSSRLLEYEVFPLMLGEDVMQSNAVVVAAESELLAEVEVSKGAGGDCKKLHTKSVILCILKFVIIMQIMSFYIAVFN